MSLGQARYQLINTTSNFNSPVDHPSDKLSPNKGSIDTKLGFHHWIELYSTYIDQIERFITERMTDYLDNTYLVVSCPDGQETMQNNLARYIYNHSYTCYRNWVLLK